MSVDRTALFPRKGRARRQRTDPQPPKVCAVVGCENEVPWSEWPQDESLPVFCDPCLRANQTRPAAARREDLDSITNRDTDFAQVMGS